jgi:hypothetical protein
MPNYLDDVLARIPEERHADFLRVVHRFNIGPDSPDLIALVLQSEMLGLLIGEIRTETARVESAGASLPDTLRAAAVPIVESLADDITSKVVEGVRTNAKAAIIDILTRGIDAHQKIVTDLALEQSTAAKSLTSAAAKVVADSSAAVSQIEARAVTTASAFALAAKRLAGWSPLRIASVVLGAILLAGSFAFGLSWSKGDDALKCSVRVENVSSAYHLTTRQADLLHKQICGS